MINNLVPSFVRVPSIKLMILEKIMPIEYTIEELYEMSQEENKLMLEALEKIFELGLDGLGDCISIAAEALDAVRPLLGGDI